MENQKEEIGELTLQVGKQRVEIDGLRSDMTIRDEEQMGITQRLNRLEERDRELGVRIKPETSRCRFNL